MSAARPRAARAGDLDLDPLGDIRVGDDEKRSAALVVAARFLDRPDVAREVLEMLGLITRADPHAS